MIEAHRFGFSHRGTGRRQLQDVTCEIPAGSRVAVMGATGAGKSTLTMALNGLVPHHHPGDLYGQLRVAGMATHEASLPQLVRVAGLVSQDPQAQVMERLVLDDAAAGPANLGLPRDEVISRARRALAAVGLADLACRETTTLSGGSSSGSRSPGSSRWNRSCWSSTSRPRHSTRRARRRSAASYEPSATLAIR